jgi:hypothetical protein
MNPPHRLLAASVSFLFAAVHASGATFGNFTYVDNGANITITGCSNVTGAVDIPASIDGKPVVEIAGEAFKYQAGITGVTIPDTIGKIGKWAFIGCSALRSIELPASVESLGDEVFSVCTSLETVKLPQGLDYIPLFAFSRCIKLASVSIPEGVKIIGSSAFHECASLRTIDLPPGLSTISSSAFEYSGLTNIYIPDSVTTIDAYAFKGCSSLTGVRLPNGLRNLSSGLFEECQELEVVELPSTVEAIGMECFTYCKKLRKVDLPASLASVGAIAFGDCKSLKQVRFPKRLKRIDCSLFMFSGVEKAYFDGPAPEIDGEDELYGVSKNFQVCYMDGKKGFTWPTWLKVPSTPIGPEIMVSAPHDIPITTRVSTQSFGARVEGYKRGKTFTIRNIGTKKLKGLSTSVLNNPDGDFTCTPPLRKSLEPGESTVIRVVFQPVDDGRRDAILRIRSNDANENPITIKVHGLGMK